MYTSSPLYLYIPEAHLLILGVKMPMMFQDPFRLWGEIIYSIIIISLCFYVYFRTKDLYELTSHKGILYFRHAFFFFGLAFLSRLIFHILLFAMNSLDSMELRMIIFPAAGMFVGYLGTMAIFYLAYSTVWEKIKHIHFIIISNIVGVLIAAISFLTRSPELISIVQLPVIFFTLLNVQSTHKKKSFNMKLLYFLLSLFWLMSVFFIAPHGPRSEFRWLTEIVSVIIFSVITYKVTKWTK